MCPRNERKERTTGFIRLDPSSARPVLEHGDSARALYKTKPYTNSHEGAAAVVASCSQRLAYWVKIQARMLACAGKLEHQHQGGHVSRKQVASSEARLLAVLDVLNALTLEES